MVSQNNSSYNNVYRFWGKPLDEETGLSYFVARYYDPKLSIWLSVDPEFARYPNASPYNYCLQNPINAIDPDGRIPIPLYNKYKSWFLKSPDSWFGKRNTGLRDASKFHRGLDFNYSGGGNTDRGATVLATHDGIATVDNSSKGLEGRMVTITSPNGKFRTKYLHLDSINIKDGDSVNESSEIGQMGGSAYGREDGRLVHLHYQIEFLNEEGWHHTNTALKYTTAELRSMWMAL